MGQLGAYDLESNLHRCAIVERLEPSNAIIEKGLQSQSTYPNLSLKSLAYLLDGVVETQVWMVLDFIDILWMQDNHRLRRSNDLKNTGSLKWPVSTFVG